MEKKLEVKNLKISFRTQGGNVKAVRDISFDLYKGETLAIVGESGSGKSVTSKAIIGILAGNSIVEGGEILYDGQDLLKISEEDFHKIRGDKISMIFQDPMSSLNPIMRVGKQLTEAMILKGKTSQKNSRKNFNTKLALLNRYMDEVTATDNPEIKKQNALKCKTFDDFCIESTLLEHQYNEAYEQIVDLQLKVDDLLFLSSKNRKIDILKSAKDIRHRIVRTVNPYLVLESEVQPIDEKLKDIVFNQRRDCPLETFLALLNEIKELLSVCVQRDKPNYFTLGYYMFKNPEFTYQNTSIDELNQMTRKFLDDDFMLDFIDQGSLGVEHSHQQSIEKKKALISTLKESMTFFEKEELNKAEAYSLIKSLKKEVFGAIDYLEIVKKSAEYSFYASIKHELDRYYFGLKNNPKAQKKYDRRLARYERLSQKGSKPSWQVVPPTLVDLNQQKLNICLIIKSLIHSYEADIQLDEKFDKQTSMVALVDYFKEQASKVVYRVTRKMAKAKALKLLEEVGIPEPSIRYNQYPFEFSGGMRQRIVIAIALSANPDILICDEPTTALDVTIQSQILELINKIKVERNLSVIFITHDLGVVANMADRIAVMYAGKIVEYGTSEDIFYDPRHPYTWALLSSMPDLDTKEKLEAIPGTPPNMIYPPKGDAFAERNKYALEIDFEEQPPLFEISDTHFAATWLLHPNAPKINPPKIITDRIERMKREAAQNE